MPPEPDRILAGCSALAGGAFWGMHNLATALWANQPIHADHAWATILNVVFAAFSGFLMAYFVAPALAPLIPIASLRDMHAVGFGIGAGSWELTPFLMGFARAWAQRKVKAAEDGP